MVSSFLTMGDTAVTVKAIDTVINAITEYEFTILTPLPVGTVI